VEVLNVVITHVYSRVSFTVRIMLEARLGSSHANMECHYELKSALYGLVMFRSVWKHIVLQRQRHFVRSKYEQTLSVWYVHFVIVGVIR
jgi:hypothetical protein